MQGPTAVVVNTWQPLPPVWWVLVGNVHLYSPLDDRIFTLIIWRG